MTQLETPPGPKKTLSVSWRTIELLSAKGELFREEGQITACAVATSCCISDVPFQWEGRNFDPHSTHMFHPIFLKLKIIVPNRAVPTLQMRPFRLAKRRKTRDVNIQFLKFFLEASA